MTIENNKLELERNKLNTKLLFLNGIESANEELEQLIHNHKDTQSKELEIHLMWEKYCEL